MSLIHTFRPSTEARWDIAQHEAREIACDVVRAARATRKASGTSYAQTYFVISAVLFAKSEEMGECALGWCLENMAEEAADTATRLLHAWRH